VAARAGYHCVVVSRLRERQFDPAQATEVASAGAVQIRIHRNLDAQGHTLRSIRRSHRLAQTDPRR